MRSTTKTRTRRTTEHLTLSGATDVIITHTTTYIIDVLSIVIDLNIITVNAQKSKTYTDQNCLTKRITKSSRRMGLSARSGQLGNSVRI